MLLSFLLQVTQRRIIKAESSLTFQDIKRAEIYGLLGRFA